MLVTSKVLDLVSFIIGKECCAASLLGADWLLVALGRMGCIGVVALGLEGHPC